MSFTMQMISNHGSTNPIVARLTLQTFDLLKWIDVPDQRQERLVGMMIDAQKRLLRCYDHAFRIKKEQNDQLEQLHAGGSIDPRKLPYVMNLDADLEGFLMTATQYLRDLVPVFNELWDTSLDPSASTFWRKHGSQSAAEKCVNKAFGLDHPLVSFLDSNEHWIAELIKRRNAVEHPGGGSGWLVLKNFRVVGPRLAPPVWGRRTKTADATLMPVVPALEQLLSQLLSFGEDLFVLAAMTRPRWKHVVVREIPEESRNPACPIRYKPELDNKMTALLEKAASESNSGTTGV